ncbi:hypothetical protein EST38_g9525 [Candolleomyces aberdarensis]|uniref:Actin-like ATPase domain-containing protein n=1 Tax=Candolleomyces aberdarensis TaxID=2316362 RepID=A0A4Q2DCM5_9AGAR|nr:hypothetical protein EST38_g9525 [Candolleomyces aberdarensis]
MFATYLPPPTTLSAAINVPAANRATRVPLEVLTDATVEEIKTRCCFVGSPLDSLAKFQEEYQAGGDTSSDIEMTPADVAQSESSSSHAGFESVTSSQAGSASEFSIITNSQAETSVQGIVKSEGYLQALASMYKKHSTATDLKMRVQPVQQIGTGLGTLVIPGWIRERAAEVLFEGDVDESSLAEIILDALLKVPIDLRKTLTSSILVSGGTAMLPGFIPRLHSEILKALSPPPAPPPSRQNSPSKSNRPLPPQYDKYAALRPLTPYFAILNNSTPPAAPSERARANAGRAPAFAPAMLAWVGGSLAGALKTGGSEVIRENWDETEGPGGTGEDENEAAESSDAAMDTTSSPSRKAVLPDWTRSPLRPGAPPARAAAATAAPSDVAAFASAAASIMARMMDIQNPERQEG